MPVYSIQQQPPTDQMMAAYQPIHFRIIVNGVLIVVAFADVYINGVYYKTIQKTQPRTVSGTTTIWDFFIQAAVQEVLQKHIGPNGDDNLWNVAGTTADVFVRFRGAYLDADGFTVPDTPHPIQATATQPPVPSGGIQSNTFLVVNAVLQHHHNLDLGAHLGAYRTGTWDPSVWPLTHRPAIVPVGSEDSDHFPFLCRKSPGPITMGLWCRYNGATSYTYLTAPLTLSPLGDNALGGTADPQVFLLPSGPKNLRTPFPSVEWEKVQDYYLEVYDGISPVTWATILTTPRFRVHNNRTCESVRLHFLNDLGHFDAVSFLKPRITVEDSGSEYLSPLTHPREMRDAGLERVSVRANYTYEVRRPSTPDETAWLAELKTSPKVFLEWTATEGQTDDYLPVVLQPGPMEVQKNEMEWSYETKMQFKLANEYPKIRN